MNFFRYQVVLLLLLIFAPSVKLKAQSNAITCEFTADTVVTGYGQTFSNKLKLYNKSAQIFVLTNGTSSVSGLLQLPDTVIIAPGTAKYVPLKYLSSEAIFSDPAKKITVK